MTWCVVSNAAGRSRKKQLVHHMGNVIGRLKGRSQWSGKRSLGRLQSLRGNSSKPSTDEFRGRSYSRSRYFRPIFDPLTPLSHFVTHLGTPFP